MPGSRGPLRREKTRSERLTGCRPDASRRATFPGGHCIVSVLYGKRSSHLTPYWVPDIYGYPATSITGSIAHDLVSLKKRTVYHMWVVTAPNTRLARAAIADHILRGGDFSLGPIARANYECERSLFAESPDLSADGPLVVY
jgi:hypothetical protein